MCNQPCRQCPDKCTNPQHCQCGLDTGDLTTAVCGHLVCEDCRKACEACGGVMCAACVVLRNGEEYCGEIDCLPDEGE